MLNEVCRRHQKKWRREGICKKLLLKEIEEMTREKEEDKVFTEMNTIIKVMWREASYITQQFVILLRYGAGRT